MPFSSVCKALGVHLDLNGAKLGAAQLSNTPDRMEELTERYPSLPTPSCRKVDEKLSQGPRDLGKHITSGRKALAGRTVGARAAISSDSPRKVCGSSADHIHIYVDASYDPERFSGIGGICFDSCGRVLGFSSEEAPKETGIMELEMITR